MSDTTMALFKQYRRGQELGRGQTLRFATRVTLLEDNPERYERESLQALANRPFAIEEWLLASEDYLIYRTGAPVLEHLRRVLLDRALRLATEPGSHLLTELSKSVDHEEETSMWLPLRGAHARPWAFKGEASALLGSKPVAFYYYEIRVAAGALFFLQQPVGHRRARRDFEQLSQLLRSPSVE